MERVHGKFTIRRKIAVKQRKQYRGYKADLKEDFHNICGYCGKNFDIITSEVQIDHIVPKKKYPGLEHEYTNLVYSCRVCNRNKSDDWPLDRSDIHNDGTNGYIDPASTDYDLALERDVGGNIVAKNPVGMYMHDKLNFGFRRLDICWVLEKIENKKSELETKIDDKRKVNVHDVELQELYLLFYELQRKFDSCFKKLKVEKERI